ncbi:glycosyltransferase family 4 protein [Mesorhizobium sp. A556]
MRIIFANRYFYPDQSATSRMISSLAFALAERGCDVAVIASRSCHDNRDAVLPARETINGVAVHRLWSPGFGKHGIAGRAMDYAAFHLSAAAWWLRHAGRDDLCVVCTDPPLLTVTAAAALGLTGAKKVDWIMDLFPETAMELGMIDPRKLPGRLFLALRDWAHKRSALLLCPTATMARHIEAGQPEGKRGPAIAITHHWSNGDEIHPVTRNRNDLRRQWGLGDAFVVGYSGNFGRAHEFTTLLDAAEMLREEQGIRFLLIGDGQQLPFVKAEVARRDLRNVLFKPFQPSERLTESMGAADIHIVSLRPRLEHCIIPSKFYGILAAARPTLFIGASDGEIASILRDRACGDTVEPGQADLLARRIIDLKASPSLVAAMGERAHRLFESDYARDRGVTEWLRAISPLLGTEPRPIRAIAAVSGGAGR